VADAIAGLDAQDANDQKDRGEGVHPGDGAGEDFGSGSHITWKKTVLAAKRNHPAPEIRLNLPLSPQRVS
jgi:hypothetical protein